MTFLHTDSLLSDTDPSVGHSLLYCLFLFRTENNKFVKRKRLFLKASFERSGNVEEMLLATLHVAVGHFGGLSMDGSGYSNELPSRSQQSTPRLPPVWNSAPPVV
jgi:hypothetical protein